MGEEYRKTKWKGQSERKEMKRGEKRLENKEERKRCQYYGDNSYTAVDVKRKEGRDGHDENKSTNKITIESKVN